MTTTATEKTIPDVYPTLRYRDARSAIAWLQETFGFKQVVVYDDDAGGVAHAELAFGNGAIMLGNVRGSDGVEAENAGGASVYVRVDDVKSHYEHAKAHGAEIVREIQVTEYDPAGAYSARDPEGNMWSFGGYGVELPARE